MNYTKYKKGLVIEIVLLLVKSYGIYDIKKNKSASLDIVYPIASVSKSVAATAIMILNESGLIGLDDNISEYLPFDLKNPNFPDINITFRMLLAHQSSLSDTIIRFSILFSFLRIPYEKMDLYFTPGKLLYKQNIWNHYPPGENVCYSTVGFEVIGYLVEQITGQPFDEFCKKNIFEPLDMMNTSYRFGDFDKDKLAVPYMWYFGRYLRLPFIQTRMFAGGGVKTTVLNLAHFLIMHTTGGIYNGKRILNESSVEEMHRSQYNNSYDGIFLHGLGWYFNESSDGEILGGHGGDAIGCRAVMKMRYSDKVGVIYFWNQNKWIQLHYNKIPDVERDARRLIEEALFEKADKL